MGRFAGHFHFILSSRLEEAFGPSPRTRCANSAARTARDVPTSQHACGQTHNIWMLSPPKLLMQADKSAKSAPDIPHNERSLAESPHKNNTARIGRKTRCGSSGGAALFPSCMGVRPFPLQHCSTKRRWLAFGFIGFKNFVISPWNREARTK